MDYITDYDLCPACQSVIRQLAGICQELPDEYASDEEGPLMAAYDFGMLCDEEAGGRYCKKEHEEKPVRWDISLSVTEWGDKHPSRWGGKTHRCPTVIEVEHPFLLDVTSAVLKFCNSLDDRGKAGHRAFMSGHPLRPNYEYFAIDEPDALDWMVQFTFSVTESVS